MSKFNIDLNNNSEHYIHIACNETLVNISIINNKLEYNQSLFYEQLLKK